MKKRILAVLLSAVLLLSLCTVALASADRPFYLVLGDSIAFGSGLANPREAVYGKVVADTNGYDYANYAVPGHTTANLMKRMENETVRDAIARADIISISIGGNNFLLGNLNALLFDGIVKQDYTKLDAIAAGFLTDLDTILTTIRAQNQDAAIVLQTLYNPQTGYIGEVYQQGANRLNQALRTYDEAHPGAILIADVGAALTDSDRDFAEDRIHPSAAGNEKIARVVLQTLKDNGLGSAAEPVIQTAGKDAHGMGIFTVFVNLYGNFFHVLAVVRGFFARLFKA